MSDRDYKSPDKVLTKDDWKNANRVSSAVNLIAIAISFPNVIKKIQSEADARGIRDVEWPNRHPIILIYLCQIAMLTGGYLADPEGKVLDAFEVLTHKLNFQSMEEEDEASNG